MLKKRGSIFILIFVASFSKTILLAQSTANYTFSTATGASLTDMSSGTTQLIGASSDDAASSVTTIGFDFWFMGTRYYQFSANSNGLLRLGSTAVGTTFTNDLATTSNLPLIAPFWDDLGTSSSGKVHYKMTGSSPNRVLVVEWSNMEIDYSSSSSDGTFQCRLYETTGVIEFVYGAMAIGSGSGTVDASIGFSNSSATNSVLSLTSISSPAVTTTVGSVVNNLVNSSTAGAITNLNSSSDGSRRIYTFTPPVPTAPSGFSTSSITSSGMTLNWTDNSSNERGFAIYRSDDGGSTYSYVAQAAAGATSSAQSSLAPSTTYYWKVYAVSEGGLSSAISGSGTTSTAGTCTSTATGNWGTAGTWSCGYVPTAGDIVTIANGHTVTINTTAYAYTLTVGQGTSGILKFDNTARTITIGDDVTVASGGTFQANSSGSQTGHVVSVGGDFTNNGTTDFYVTANRAATLKFTGSSNATFSGTGGTTDIYALTIDKGTSYSSVLEISTSNFTIRGATTTTSAILTLTNGMLKISGSFTGNHYLFTSANYAIGSTAGFYLNNSNFTVAAQAGYMQLYGKLQIDAGTYSIGTTTDHDLSYYGGGTLVVNGGTLNVAEAIYPYTSSPYYYTQTGGTVVVCTGASNPYDQAGSFHLDNNCTFTMSGGTIVIRNPSSVATAANAYDYYNFSGTRTITGGTVQFGDASTSGAKTFQVSGGYFPGIGTNNSGGNHTVKLSTLSSVVPTISYDVTLANNTTLDAGLTYSADATIGGSVTIGTGATYTHGTATHTIGGNFSNSGTYTTSTGTVTFNGSASQNVGGTSTTSFYNLTNSNSSTGLVLTGNIGVSNSLAMSGATADINLSSYTIDLSTTGSITGESNTDRIYGTGSITATRTLSNISALDIAGMGLELTSAANLGSTVVTRTHTEYTDGTFVSILRNYLITPTTNSGLNATMKFNYFDNELNGQGVDEADFVLWRSTDLGANWTNRSGTVTTAGNYVTLSGIDAFSMWMVAAPRSTPLPVSLVYFKASPKKNNVVLSWETASELNSDYFEVQSSFDGEHFHPIGIVDAAGNSTHKINYSLIDDNYVNGINYYRLIQNDKDGYSEVSKVVAVDMTKQKADIVKTVNSLGQEVNELYTGVVFDVYSDGSSVKRLQ